MVVFSFSFLGFGLIKLDLKTKSENGLVSCSACTGQYICFWPVGGAVSRLAEPEAVAYLDCALCACPASYLCDRWSGTVVAADIHRKMRVASGKVPLCLLLFYKLFCGVGRKSNSGPNTLYAYALPLT